MSSPPSSRRTETSQLRRNLDLAATITRTPTTPAFPIFPVAKYNVSPHRNKHFEHRHNVNLLTLITFGIKLSYIQFILGAPRFKILRPGYKRLKQLSAVDTRRNCESLLHTPFPSHVHR